jgi:hypothetical protein
VIISLPGRPWRKWASNMIAYNVLPSTIPQPLEIFLSKSPIVAPTLSILCLCFKEPTEEEVDESNLYCYEVVEVFFSRCLWIRCLQLYCFDFGDDPTFLTPTIMDGFGRLKSLDVIDCRGDMMMFAEHAPIQDLSNLKYDLEGIDPSNANDIISVISKKCRSLKSISLSASFQSWQTFHKVVECCRNLEEVILYNSSLLPLTNSELVAVASLPRLKSLDLSGCLSDKGAISCLAKCKGLRHLRGYDIKLSSDVVRAIGGNLISLQCKLGTRGCCRVLPEPREPYD